MANQPPVPGGIPGFIPPYPNHHRGPGYNPTFDGRFNHGLTTSPYLNSLFEITNGTQVQIEQLGYINAMTSGGFDPNLAMYNSTIAPGLQSASQIYHDAMGHAQGQGGSGGGHGGGGGQSASMGSIAVSAGTGALAGAAIGSLIAPGPGTAIGAVAGGVIGGVGKALGFL